MSFFANTPTAPPDAIFGLTTAFNKDPSPNKLNLGVGAFRTEEGKPLVLNSVQKADEFVTNSKTYNHEYLPMEGLASFYNGSAKVLFGNDLIKDLGNKLVSMQCLSGTGALRTGFEFVKKFLPGTKVLYSEQTWPNHKNIFAATGLENSTYRYYDRSTNALNMDGLLQDIRAAPEKSLILLHACAHNPTGMDPTQDEWQKILQAVKERNHLVFMDCAYQGFASGDLDKDAYAIRLFASSGVEMFVAQSFAKNFGLYGERIGTLHVVLSSDGYSEAVRSQLKQIARATYSNPPCRGAYIVAKIFSDEALLTEWKGELAAMAGRIQAVRQKLFDALKEKGIVWEHLIKQIGMFGYTGLTASQVERLTNVHHVYLTSDGRISLAGLQSHTIPVLADAIYDVVQSSNSKM
eukprot:TRINITY_DN643_c0_g1_i1.p1 TRINITY_DN643_c0_g1~~TRINITY_DN643_c0_g1_i1.p1  ORF type:complete len:406 (-),score=118.73 TRINITY_DN643_c0_g1_i1:44-1261(-)